MARIRFRIQTFEWMIGNGTDIYTLIKSESCRIFNETNSSRLIPPWDQCHLITWSITANFPIWFKHSKITVWTFGKFHSLKSLPNKNRRYPRNILQGLKCHFGVKTAWKASRMYSFYLSAIHHPMWSIYHIRSRINKCVNGFRISIDVPIEREWKHFFWPPVMHTGNYKS